MFDSIRKHQRLLQFVLLLLIMPAFVFFGVSGYQRFLNDGDDYATVDGDHISRQEFEQAQRQRIDQMREMLGNQVDSRMFDTPSARAEVLEGLVVQRLIAHEAIQRGIKISDDRLRDSMASMLGLRKPDGSIDIEKYRLLRTQIEPRIDPVTVSKCNVRPRGGLFSQPSPEPLLDASVRCDLASQTIPEALGQSSLVPQAVVDRIVMIQEQTREVRSVTFAPADFAGKVKVTPEQARKYYDDNARLYEIPERAKVEYVVLSADALAKQVTIDEAQLKDYYEQNKARFTTQEQRRASHVLIKLEPNASDDAKKAARAKADEVLAKARAGGDFAALAKASSQDPGSANTGGDLGFFSRDMMVKPFADAVWSMKEGEISGVVESEFGLHVIKMTGVNAGGQKTFEQVRPEIEGDFRRQQASAKFAEAAETFTNTVYEQSDSLKPAADKLKLQIRSADDVTRNGAPAAGPEAAVLANPKLLASLFSQDSIRSKRNTEAVEVGGNTLVSARLVDYKAPERKPFESVEAEVRNALVEQESRRLAVEAGEARLKALREGAEASGFGAPTTVSRMTDSKLLPAAIEAIFRADAEKLPAFAGANLGGVGYSVFQVTKVTMPDEKAVAEKRVAYRQQLAQLLAQQELNAYLDSLKARAKIERRLERLAPAASSPDSR